MNSTEALGRRVYNRGNVCNQPHWGRVTKILKDERWGDQVQITPEEEAEDRDPYWILPSSISEVDSGNGSTRIVTEEAYRRHEAATIQQMQEDRQRLQGRSKP